MRRDAPREDVNAVMRHDSEDSGTESESDDSFLRQVLQVEPSSRLPIPGESLGGPDGRRFEILALMGRGGMGQVFRAHDAVLHREVALKFLLPRPGLEKEVLREARAVARLDHENIVRIFDVSEWHGAPGAPGVPFLVMECLEGESLSSLLKRGALDVERALGILDSITEGLAHAHERHLVHRDLKPGNVFLTRQGVVKLLDFGLSHLAVEPGHSEFQPTGGTPAYMAPEQWRGEPQDARTDIWAAGVVLYEMLTGTLPFEGATPGELCWRVTSGAPIPSVAARNPEVPRQVDALLATLLARAPTRRLSSALELREELRELRGRLPGARREETGPTATPERRQVTVVSCQLAGLAEGGAPLDAEDMSELETAFHETCVSVIERHGGSVALSMGGEVLACFGCTQGREDDSERAVRAGLQLARESRDSLRRGLPHLPLSGLFVRSGVHTDVMAVGTRPQGEAPKVAAWLARQAGPGGVVVSDRTWKLVRGAFQAEPLGSHSFEGLSGSVSMEAHHVLRERELASRFERSYVAGGLSPLVGREHELGRLLALWEQARQGQGSFVLASGEAGIGKSRILQELCERVAPESPLLLRVQCWSRFSTHAESLVPALLQDVVRFAPDDSPRRRLRKLEEGLWPMGLLPEDVQLVGQLLALPVPEDSPVLQLTPERRKKRTFDVLSHIVLHRAGHERPMLLVVEDLHWADSFRLEFLGLLLERIEEARLLVVLSARPELQPGWARCAWFHKLVLERLPAGLAATLAREVARGQVLPEETIQRLVSRTDGIPLFIEEMTRMVLESGEAASIPVTLHELLLARLDLLPSRQKTLAQVCAVLGREFSHSLLSAVSERDEAVLRRQLSGLEEAGLLRKREGTDASAYQFRHALIQDAAYQSLSRSTRRQYHQLISRVLVERFPELVEAKPEVLAYHYTEAGEHALALGYWERAGRLALQWQTGPEALEHFTRALELLPAVTDAEQRLHVELRIRMFLGIMLMELHGFYAPETERMYDRVHVLIPQVGEALTRLEPSVEGPFAYYLLRSEFHRLHELALRLMDLGQCHGHRGLWLMGCRMSASALFTQGRPREAAACLERAPDCSDFTLEEQRKLAARYWLEPVTATWACGAIVYTMLGRVDESRRWAREALTLAGRIGHPHTTAYTQVYVALACSRRRDVPEILTLTEQAMALSSERGFKVWLLLAALLRGWALSELGRPREGLALLQRYLEGWRVMGWRIGTPLNMSLLADTHLKLGQVQDALAAVDEGLSACATTGEHGVYAMLHRLRGECLRRLGREDEAKQCFLRAIAVAHEQGAGLFELRATVSLCRQLRDLGRTRVARRLLSRAHARAAPGGDCVDLREARTLLDELSRGARR
jgi:class 3 adenylate cyclase/tetratricopeptide (TPR) repeat protein